MTASSLTPAALETVKVRLSPALVSRAGRLETARGVEHVGGRIVDGVAYRDGAICPRAEWRPAADRELPSLLASEAGATGDAAPAVTIEVAPVPESFLLAFRNSGLAAGWTEQEYAAFVRGPAYQAALETALPVLAPFVESAEGLQLLGTCVQGGNLWSTTTHADPGQPNLLSGLHVDNWDRLPLGERGRGRRQMCINLGADDRFFVFVRADVDTVVTALGRSFDRAESYLGIGRELFARAPGASIARVRVRPGEMYVAPTDNLIHDGSTLGSTSPDITLNLRGHFDVARWSRALAAGSTA